MTLTDRIKACQRAVGAKDDGVAGPVTWEKIYNVLIPPTPTAVAPMPEQPTASPVKLQHNDWPAEADAASFFKYPSELVSFPVIYPMHMDAINITRITCNTKVADSLQRIFRAIYEHYNRDMSAIKAAGLDAYDGCYNDRNKRQGGGRSMHAYGAAIDIDAAHNGQGSGKGRMPSAVVAIFKAEGWRWGGDYHGLTDPMHFEACT